MLARILAVLSEWESGREDGPILRRINAWIDRDFPERQAGDRERELVKRQLARRTSRRDARRTWWRFRR